MIALPLLLLLAGAGADGGHDHEDHQKYVGGAPWSTPLGPDPVASDGGLEMLEVRCKEPHPERTQWGHADPELTLAIVAVYDSDLPADEVPTVDDVRAHFWGPRAAAWLDKISDGCAPLAPDVFVVAGIAPENCDLGDADWLEALRLEAVGGCDGACPLPAYDPATYDVSALIRVGHCATTAWFGTLEFTLDGAAREAAGIYQGMFAASDYAVDADHFEGTFAHELLHAYGAGYHSNLFECTDPATDLLDPTGCAVLQYGDAHDVLGTSNRFYNNLNAMARQYFGWLGVGDFHVVKSRGTFTLSPLNEGRDAPFPRAAVLADSDVWIEWRSAPDLDGEDATILDENPGLFLRQWQNLIDADLDSCDAFESSAGFPDAHGVRRVSLKPGATFVSRYYGIVIRALEATDSGTRSFEVHVTGEDQICVRNLPRVNVGLWGEYLNCDCPTDGPCGDGVCGDIGRVGGWDPFVSYPSGEDHGRYGEEGDRWGARDFETITHHVLFDVSNEDWSPGCGEVLFTAAPAATPAPTVSGAAWVGDPQWIGQTFVDPMTCAALEALDASYPAGVEQWCRAQGMDEVEQADGTFVSACDVRCDACWEFCEEYGAVAYVETPWTLEVAHSELPDGFGFAHSGLDMAAGEGRQPAFSYGIPFGAAAGAYDSCLVLTNGQSGLRTSRVHRVTLPWDGSLTFENNRHAGYLDVDPALQDLCDAERGCAPGRDSDCADWADRTAGTVCDLEAQCDGADVAPGPWGRCWAGDDAPAGAKVRGRDQCAVSGSFCGGGADLLETAPCDDGAAAIVDPPCDAEEQGVCFSDTTVWNELLTPDGASNYCNVLGDGADILCGTMFIDGTTSSKSLVGEPFCGGPESVGFDTTGILTEDHDYVDAATGETFRCWKHGGDARDLRCVRALCEAEPACGGYKLWQRYNVEYDVWSRSVTLLTTDMEWSDDANDEYECWLKPGPYPGQDLLNPCACLDGGAVFPAGACAAFPPTLEPTAAPTTPRPTDQKVPTFAPTTANPSIAPTTDAPSVSPRPTYAYETWREEGGRGCDDYGVINGPWCAGSGEEKFEQADGSFASACDACCPVCAPTCPPSYGCPAGPDAPAPAPTAPPGAPCSAECAATFVECVATYCEDTGADGPAFCLDDFQSGGMADAGCATECAPTAAMLEGLTCGGSGGGADGDGGGGPDGTTPAPVAATQSPTTCDDPAWVATRDGFTCDDVANLNEEAGWEKKKSKKNCRKYKSEDKKKAKKACDCYACDKKNFVKKKKNDVAEGSVAIIVPVVIAAILLVGAILAVARWRFRKARQHRRSSMPWAGIGKRLSLPFRQTRDT